MSIEFNDQYDDVTDEIHGRDDFGDTYHLFCGSIEVFCCFPECDGYRMIFDDGKVKILRKKELEYRKV